jgi:hypothetical protein
MTDEVSGLEEIPDAHKLAERLNAEHKSGQYLYRGQAARYPRHKYLYNSQLHLTDSESIPG